MPVRRYRVAGPLDLRRTLAPLARGPADRSIRFGAGRVVRACRTPDGPASVALAQTGDEVTAEAWGPGAERALDEIPALLGLLHEPEPLVFGHPTITHLARRFPGIRIPRSGAVLEALVPAILEQKVVGEEARRAYVGLIRVHGAPAPGPPEWGLRLPPAPSTLAGLPYYDYHPFGVERRRAELIRRVASRAAWFEGIVDLSLPDAYARLMAVPGIGPWTAAEVAVRALGDATRSASATSTCPTWSPSPWPASRAETTPGCSSSWSRTAASGPGSSACSSSAGSGRRATDHGCHCAESRSARRPATLGICHLGVMTPSVSPTTVSPIFTRSTRLARLDALLRERILVLDGGMGTLVQAYTLTEADFRGERFRDHPRDLRGNTDLICLTRPDIVTAIHGAYLDAGADIIETNTFTATRIAQADYGLESVVAEINREGARLARAAADAAEAADPTRPRYVMGALGPTNRTASISPDVSDPGARNVTFDELAEAYAESAQGLIEGGADLLVIETIFDTLNAKAAIFGVESAFDATGDRDPADHLRNDHRRLRTDPLRPDRRGVLHLDRARQTAGRGAQLRAWRPTAAWPHRGPRANHRAADHRLPQRGSAQRVRRLRRVTRDHRRATRHVRSRRPRQHRGWLLWHDPGAHQGHRGGVGRRRAAGRPGRRAQDPAVRPPGTGHPAARRGLRQRRRADQRDRLAQVRQARFSTIATTKPSRWLGSRSRRAPS